MPTEPDAARCSECGGTGNHFFADHEPVYAPDAAPSRRVRREHRAKRLTDTEYLALLLRQGGRCAICGNPPKNRRLHVDHDHRTGTVRGLLCFRCNRALPNYVTEEWLRKAIAYLTA